MHILDPQIAAGSVSPSLRYLVWAEGAAASSRRWATRRRGRLEGAPPSSRTRARGITSEMHPGLGWQGRLRLTFGIPP
jgi:hypothetical protein